jgi:NAD(P)-dependent dehydrogenase (short-subunit alcohol dehydrogenase family)
MDLNVKSLFFLTQKLLPALRVAASADEPARVINIGSIDGINVGMFSALSYGASKAAVHHLTRVLAKQLVSEHINVNAIAPGPFETAMLKPMLDNMGDAIVESNPMGRVGQTSDIAGTAIFLSSRASNFISGTVIPVDGGLVNMA